MNKLFRILCVASFLFGAWNVSAQSNEADCTKGPEPLYHRYLKVDNWGKDPEIKCEGEVVSFYKTPSSTLLLSKPALRDSEIESAKFMGQYWQLVDQVKIEPSGDKDKEGKAIEGAYTLDTNIVANAFPLQAVCPSPEKFTQDGNDPYGVGETPKYNKQACIESLRLLQEICKYDLDCNQYEKEKILGEVAQNSEAQNKEIKKLEAAYNLAKAQAEKKAMDDITTEITKNVEGEWENIKDKSEEYIVNKEVLKASGITYLAYAQQESLKKAAEDQSVKDALTKLNEARKSSEDATAKTTDENKLPLEEKNKKAQELRERINFLDNRISELDMSILIEDSSGFNVTNVLQMKENSKEGQLKIIGGDSKRNIFDKIIRLIAQTIGTFGVLLLIVAAFYMITSQGDENQLQKGKQIFIYTALGLLVAFLSYTIVQLVLDLLLW
ncbi:hypothetical protein HC823_00815 [Candidatus Gracilibacteria bacterium]|nr:hypothetical protein [Candidatus Gracilibacteria bacterium]